MPESMKFQIPPLDLWMDEERGNGHQNQQEEHYPDPCFFPSLSKQATGSGGWLRSRTQVPVILGVQMVQLCQSIDVTIPAVLLGAWGLVLRAYTGTDAVCFGYVEPVADTSQSDSAVLRSPCFLDMTEDLAPTHLVKQAQNEWMRLRETRPCSSNSCGQSNNISSAAQFNTSLAFVSPTSTGTIRALSVTEGWTRDAPDQDGLLLEIDMQSAEVVLFYGNSMLTADQAIGVLDAFCVAVAGVTDDKNPTIRGLSLLGDRDRERIYGWNAVIPEPASQCIHELIEARCKLQPERPAVNAWDGNFTYQQLSRLSAELAAKLVTKGVGREVFVPICLEKSRWVVVAMLGVMKAGAAMVLLDVSHPPARLQQICREVSSQVVLTSPESATMARTLARQVVVLGYGEHERGKLASEIEIPSVKAENALYAVFTSGSTGSPKGVIIEHATFHSSVQPYTQALLLDRESRVFQFASYAFDVIIFDTLIALIVGGCVCIPSDTDRWSDVARTIERFQVNHVSITPTVARLLNPQEVPTLKTLALGGEQLSATDVARWTDHVHVINLYGASECPIISLQRKSGGDTGPGEISFSTGSANWIVDPQNHETLLPIGAVGELLVEGPIAGRGYLNNPDATAQSFPPIPSWLRRFRGYKEQHGRRIYKAGDMVSYNADGSLRFVCRKDTQVKLRGQRIELSEVQHHLRQTFRDAADVVAEVVTAVREQRPPMLVAFIAQDARSTGDDNGTESHVAILAEPTNEFRSQSERSRHHMQEALPPYMVPAIFLPLRTLPLTRTSKTDRRRLRELAGALTRKELEQFQPEPTRQRPPITEMEKVVQRYYADILHIPQVKVGADDHFFHRGGDSVTAMALVASARKNHHKITVKDIFDHPRLWEIALIMQSGSDWTESLPQRFSLLGPVELQHVITTAAAQCSIDPNAIEDIYPCTPLQEGLVALSVQDSGPSFVTKISLAVPADLELERLQHAWNKVAEANPILRTRIIVSDLHGMLQVVVREHIAWDMHLTTAQVPEYPAVLGDSLVQFAISPVEGRPDAIYQLVIHMHHAVYDGWTLPLLLDDLKAAYNELSLPIRPFTPFIRYLARMQGQEAYWKSVMTGIHGAVFPSLPLTTCHPTPRTAISIRTTINPPADRDFTANTYISLAWALTQGQIQDSHDVFFGAVRSGRNSSVPGIETMTGPTIASVPSRIIFNPADLVRYALQKIQKDMTDGIPFEQTGLQNIRRFGPDAARACSFQTLLVVQPERRGGDSSLLPEMTSTTDHYAWVTYCLTLICNLEADALHIEAVFDDHVVPEKQMQGILTQFIRILHQLHANTLVPIANLLSLAPDTASWSGQLEDGTTFWKEELGEREGLPTFPRLPSISYVPSVDQRLEYCFTTSLDSQTPPDATETMLLAAWGILQARFLASSETVFGAALDNSRVVPFKVRIDQELAVEDYLVAIRNRFHKFLYHRSDGFEAIARLGNVPAPACGFESLLMMRRDCKTTCRNSELQSLNKALVIEIASDSDSTIVQALFDSNVISTQVVTRMLQQFEHVALQLSKKRAIAMKEVELATPRDKEDIYRWNGTIDRRSNTTVHSLIQRQIENHPKDQAICSWDGDMTYEQLDRVSTKLAGYLMDFGIDTETYIPICFEKSLWSIVAMLAVMKAGAAFVPLDPSAPESRLQTMIEAVQATTMLSSKAQHDRHPYLAQKTIVLDKSWERLMADQSPRRSSNVSPSNAVYVIFTSGSTGTPKGIVIEHGAFCTAALAHQAGLSLGRRVLQFSSCAFDVSLGEILSTLVHGGVVCVPSEQERRENVASAINRMEVDYAFLTPSFASTVDPSSVPTLRTLCLAGEPMSATILETWARYVHLVNGYGPAECCVISAANRNVTIGSHPANIGTAVGGACWVADPDNDQILSPVGAIGELLIEGHNLARCYINQPEMTQRSFIPRPQWMPFSRCDRLYKTGDLVQYQEDGSLVYVGRKDTQVKIRGQRVELGEIERQIVLAAEGLASAVIVVFPNSGPFAHRLVAMLQLLSPQGETSGGKVLAPVPMHQLSLLGMDTAAITRKIEEFLPSYMIPDRYIAVERLPTSLAAKLDRKRVESWLTQPPSEVLPRWGSETESEIRDVEPMLGPDETVAIAISCRIAALMERDRDVSPVLEGRDFAIAAAGLDSIQVTSLVGFLRQTYAVNIPVRKMLDGTATVRSLAALVTHDKPAGTEPRSIDLTGEVARLVRTVNRQLPAPRVPSPQPRDQVVFLTGCTSLLGTEILHQLCETPDVRQVIVHVRAKTAQEASTRCKNAARRANWWSEERHGHKVEVWAGDLSQPRLGLSDQHWACISGGPSVQGSAGAGSCVVDAIIHAGAAVNWNAGYGLLRAVNVDSTVDLIRAALASPARPRLVYVSGGHSWDLEETDASLADQVVSSGSGYSQSKFVAEMVVRHFAAHHPYSGQLSIVKPGLIIGTPQDGVPNIDDYLWRITAAAVGVGSYSAEDLNTGLWITSSCQVAETIVRKALALEASDRPITYITDGVTVSEYWDTVNDALGGEQRLIAVPHDLWVSRVTQAIDIRGRNHPLWPVKEIFEEVDGHFGGADFSSLRLDHHKPHVKAAIRKNVEFLVKLDFLGASDEKARPSSEGAFRRTGQVWSSAKTA